MSERFLVYAKNLSAPAETINPSLAGFKWYEWTQQEIDTAAERGFEIAAPEASSTNVVQPEWPSTPAPSAPAIEDWRSFGFMLDNAFGFGVYGD